MRRSLIYFWRSNLAIALGAATATAVLTGALLVGDSLRGSLTSLASQRLGAIEQALVGGGFFRAELAEELAADLDAATAPAILLRGAAVHADSAARASGVQVVGLDQRLAAFYPESLDLDFRPQDGQIQPSVLVNETLAAELGAALGDEIVLTFERPAEVPRETVVGRDTTAETVASMRLAVRAVLADSGLGGFSLTPNQTAPLNAFVELDRLQRELFGRGGAERVNLTVAGGAEPEVLAAAANRLARPADLGLSLRAQGRTLVVESREFVLPALQARTIEALVAELGGTTQPVLTYLANTIAGAAGSVPYSTVAALDPEPETTFDQLFLADGRVVGEIAEGEILLNAWAAADLDAEPGEELTLSYYTLGPRDELAVESATLRLAGVVQIAGLAADPSLTPAFPGMHDAEYISAWDPPFPIDLSRIRDRDEQYWDLYRATPKAFVSAAAGRSLWTTRFGDRTSLRVAPPAGTEVEDFTEKLLALLPARLGDAGLSVLPVRANALRQARGATDFAGLFFGLSMFLIASAALLVGLLFRLAVEQRAPEVGVLRAVGFTEQKTRRRFLWEGLLLAGLGALVGVAGGTGYAWLMLTGLRTWWLPAIGAPVLFLHVEPASLAIGLAASLAVVAATIWLALRELRKLPVPSLLAGSLGRGAGRVRRTRARFVVLAAATGAAALAAGALASDDASNPVWAFAIGACLLVGGIAAFATYCGAAGRISGSKSSALGLLAMSVRNSGRHRGRSVLSVALIASAVFSIVAVAANRGHDAPEVSSRSSGAGGFELVAESDVAILEHLGSREGRGELGLAADDEIFNATEIVGFRLLPGEDASCLNLYRPEKPRILGVPDSLVARGGFSFQQTLDGEENPWRLLERDLGPGVVPAIGDFNSVKWILHSGLGKDLVMTDESGREVALRFVGLLKKSVFQSEILISDTRFTELFPRRAGESFFLIDAPDAEAATVRSTLESGLARYGFDVTPTTERLAAYQAIENTYISTFETLGGLGLVLGTLGLGIVLLRNVLERRSELATLRAFGFRRPMLARMVLFENAYLLLAGVAIGAFAGISAAAPHLVTLGAGFPWASLALTLVAVLAVGMLSSLLAVRRVLVAPLITALRSR
jgi:ABC-type antimicrobial peptide transport system permease subunit